MATHTLYQVYVTDQNGQAKAISPAVNIKSVLEPLVYAVNKTCAAGKERAWHDARIETIHKIVN